MQTKKGLNKVRQQAVCSSATGRDKQARKQASKQSINSSITKQRQRGRRRGEERTEKRLARNGNGRFSFVDSSRFDLVSSVFVGGEPFRMRTGKGSKPNSRHRQLTLTEHCRQRPTNRADWMDGDGDGEDEDEDEEGGKEMMGDEDGRWNGG